MPEPDFGKGNKGNKGKGRNRGKGKGKGKGKGYNKTDREIPKRGVGERDDFQTISSARACESMNF